MPTLRSSIGLLLFCIAALPQVCLAAVIASGDFTPDQATWSNSTAIRIGSNFAGQVDVDAGDVLQSNTLTLGATVAGNGTLNVAGAGSEIRVSQTLTTGNGRGLITISDGAAAQFNNLSLAAQRTNNAYGTLDVSGADTTVTATNSTIGYAGTGQLTVRSGAHFLYHQLNVGLNLSSVGHVVVTDPGSHLEQTGIEPDTGISVGPSGTALFQVLNGGQVSGRYVAVGSVNRAARVEVIGTGSTLQMGYGLNLGFFNGRGSLLIADGGSVSGTSGYISNSYSPNYDESVVIRGANSQWLMTSDLAAIDDYGRFIIEQGGRLESAYTSVGTAMLIDGAGSRFNSQNFLGIDRQLHLRNGAVVSAGASTTTAAGARLTIDIGYGSQFAQIGDSPSFVHSGQVLFVADALQSAGYQATPLQTGITTGYGTFAGVGGTWNETASTFTVSATTTASAGTAVDIDLSQRQRVLFENESSSLGISLAAKSMSSPVHVSATTVDTTSLQNLSRTITGGDSIAAAWNIGITGDVDVSPDPLYLTMDVHPAMVRHETEVWKLTGTTWGRYRATDLTLRDGHAMFLVDAPGTYAVAAILPGDFNSDGVVDSADYTVWRDTKNLAGNNLAADADRDNSVGYLDKHIWRTNFGRTLPGVNSQSAAVPEPASLLAAGLALLTVGICRRRAS